MTANHTLKTRQSWTLALQRLSVQAKLNIMISGICLNERWHFGSQAALLPAITFAALQAVNLGWDDVEGLLPIPDISCIVPGNRRPQSANLQWCFHVPGRAESQVRHSLEAALSLPQHQIMRTLWTSLPDIIGTRQGHVVVRPTEKWFNVCIREADPVATLSDLAGLLPSIETGNFAIPPHPLFRAVIAPVNGVEGTGLSIFCHHSLFDNLSMTGFFSDFDHLLSQSEVPVTPRMPYYIYASSYHLQREGLLAQRHVEFHRQRLDGLSKMTESFWPPPRSPKWFLWDHEGWDRFCDNCSMENDLHPHLRSRQ